MKKILSIITFLFILTLCGCVEVNSTTKNDNTNNNTTSTTDTSTTNNSSGYTHKAYIDLCDNTIETDDTSILVEDKTMTITKGGKYIITGTLMGGQIIVNVSKEEKVKLVLNNITIQNNENACIIGLSSDRIVIEAAANTDNYLTDASTYTNLIDPGVNACIYSKDDITIKGEGNIIVTGNYNNGIGTKNDLKIEAKHLYVTAAKNGLKGNESVTIIDSNIEISAINDGIKADEEIDTLKGFVLIENSNINITKSKNGIVGYRKITINNSTIDITCTNVGLDSDLDDITYTGTIKVNDEQI